MNANVLRCLRRALLPLVMCLITAASVAAPGAHGPDGEHLDGPMTNGSAGAAAPRFEATSELFEVVGQLHGGELSLLIDRFTTNEPVLRANVEIESGSIKATARFHGDLGDYAVEDPAMLKLLSTPGEHPLVITILAGEETDLLDGVLKVGSADQAAHGHRHGHWTVWWVWGLGAIILLAFLMVLARRKRTHGAAVRHELNGGQA